MKYFPLQVALKYSGMSRIFSACVLVQCEHFVSARSVGFIEQIILFSTWRNT
jgi:hypothetical protein